MSELKPCPFCGTSAKSKISSSDWYHIECGSDPGPSCCHMATVNTPEVIQLLEEKWNKRAVEGQKRADATEDRVKQLESENVRLKRDNDQGQTKNRKLIQILKGASVKRGILNATIRQLNYRLGDLKSEIKELQAELTQAKAAAVQWVTYTGEPETLPTEGVDVCLIIDERSMFGCLLYEKIIGEGIKPVWSVPFERGDFIKVEPSDRWMYLPVPGNEKDC